MRADYHVHTAFSDDSEYPMEQVVQDAIAMGLEELCFTDHVDYGIKTDWDEPEPMHYCKGGPGEPDEIPLANVDYPAYYEAFQKMRSLYGNRISLKLGLEFGMQSHTIQKYETLFDRYPFDFILHSVHEVDDKEYWNQDIQKGKTQNGYNRR